MTIETTHILLKRGNTVQSSTYTGPLGEVTIDTDLRSLRVHDGVTPGGNLVSSGTGISSTNQLVNGNKTVSLASTGLTTFPTFQTGNASLSIQGSIVGSTNAGLSILAKNEVLISTDLLGTAKNWIFETDGTLTVPSPTSDLFTLTFALTHYVATGPKPTLTLTGQPWELHGQYVYASDGRSSLMLDDPFPILINPGYASGDSFTFDADVHGRAGYTLTIQLTSVVEAGPAGWTANVIESAAPVYPSTILSNGAIKLTTDTSWTFGTGGALTLPGTVTFPDATIQSTAWTGSSSTLTDGVFTIDSFQVSTQIETWTAGATNMSPTDSISFFGHSSKLFDTSWTMSGSGITGQSAITAIDPIMSGMSITGYTVTIAQTISTGLVTGDYVFSNPPSTQGVNITSDLSTWKFGTDGNLTLPHGSTITDTASAPGWNNGQAVEIKPGGGSNVNQLLKIYPTVPSPDGNHIHITSGDLSVTDLFLGNDDQFVQIATDGKVCIGTSTSHIWTFGADGNTTMPGEAAQPYRLLASQYSYHTVTTPVIIFTGTNAAEATKATIHVKGALTVGDISTTYHQICEMLIARKDTFDANTSINTTMIEAMVYGVTHTSVAPIATFDAQYNATSMCFEITMVRDAVYTGVNAKVMATESVNLD